MKDDIISVAVIGAGAAGLSAIKILACDSDSTTRFEVTAFEQTSRIGGTWAYTDQVGKDEQGIPVHSSMYKNLRTNLPKECMHFPDFPFPKHLRSFPTQQEVQAYLEDYATHFDLWKHVEFNTMVKNVKPRLEDSNRFGVKWEVTTSKLNNEMHTQTQAFDAVLVCNGQFSVPVTPDIPGLDTFEGYMIHSHDYKEPHAFFADKTVLVVGAQSSGQDISVELASVSKKIYLCHNTPRLQTVLPSNVEQRPGIKQCYGRVVEFLDGNTVDADVIILCTGYNYNFQFLDESIGLKVEERRVTPLFKHFLHIEFPTLGIVGVVRDVIPFPLFYVQIQFFRSLLNGKYTLPCVKEMKLEEEADFNKRKEKGLAQRFAHILGNDQFDYFNDLSDMGKCPRLPQVLKDIYIVCRHHRKRDVTSFREHTYVICDDTLEVLKPE